jgi:hypothetical protein
MSLVVKSDGCPDFSYSAIYLHPLGNCRASNEEPIGVYPGRFFLVRTKPKNDLENGW